MNNKARRPWCGKLNKYFLVGEYLRFKENSYPGKGTAGILIQSWARDKIAATMITQQR